MRSEDHAIPRPSHGGRLRIAALAYGVAPEDWLDLSTGINPRPYPAPPIPADIWLRLPEDKDGLEAAAAHYYGCDEDHILPVAGSQAAIQALPQVLAGQRVSILGTTYAEHAWAWHTRGAHVMDCDDLERAADTSDIVIVVNPDNPTGRLIEPRRMEAACSKLAARGGWLVVDEAFMDPTPEASLAADAGRPALVVLRSLGKFFGLAGARVGFVLAPVAIKRGLAQILGPWAIAGPSRLVARHALGDDAWQRQARVALQQAGMRLAALLQELGPGPPTGCALFQQIKTSRAMSWTEGLARQGILVRCFDSPDRLRFGLPACEDEWQRLEAVLRRIKEKE